VWDDIFRNEEYAYGTAPNDFLVEVINKIPKGRVLCLAEGEGRNAVYLAEQGYEVVAVDLSVEGLKKARKLANDHNVNIVTQVEDLTDYKIAANYWDGIVSIYCHLPPAARKSLHEGVVRGLKVNGVFVLEGYTPAQLAFNTGGPQAKELLMSLNEIKEELAGLHFEYGVEIERKIMEGNKHTGKGSVLQIVARKQ
jgi:SAM-dependent methyltransferase